MFVNLEVVKALEHWEEVLRRESRFSFMGPSLKEFLSRWWWWCCCWEGELRSSSSACIFFSVSLWLIPAHASPLPLLLTQYIASPLHLLQRIHPYFISIPELSLPMDTNGPMSTTQDYWQLSDCHQDVNDTTNFNVPITMTTLENRFFKKTFLNSYWLKSGFTDTLKFWSGLKMILKIGRLHQYNCC